ncbi:MAG TPA: hypothetical protein VIN03_13795 [Roseateles sp.]
MTVSQPSPTGQRSVLIEWDGEPPKRLTSEELQQYREGRNAAIQALGLNALVIEL